MSDRMLKAVIVHDDEPAPGLGEIRQDPPDRYGFFKSRSFRAAVGSGHNVEGLYRALGIELHQLRNAPFVDSRLRRCPPRWRMLERGELQ